MSAGEAVEVLARLYPRLLGSLEAGAGGPFVAGVLLGGDLVGWGTNTVLRDRDVTRHAEMNALGDAGRRTGRVHLEGALLVTSHFPCLMCYHAAKWGAIREICYLFDYAETESIFGFRGDARMLADLGLEQAAVDRDASVRLTRIEDPRTDALYRRDLVRGWSSRYRARCGAYDV
jgi:tRNA(Arg) A34 adenosine deaminase TadA